MVERGFALQNQYGGPVGVAMTALAFNSARNAGFVEMRLDIQAMAEIADAVGVDLTGEGKLSPLMAVVCSEDPRTGHRRDTELPSHAGQSANAAHYFARDLSTNAPYLLNRESLVEAARRIGAPTFTEVSIAGWYSPKSHYVGQFAMALMEGQKPLDLPPNPADSLWGGVARSIGTFLYKGAIADSKTLARRNAAAENPNLRSPFVFRDRDGATFTPQ